MIFTGPDFVSVNGIYAVACWGRSASVDRSHHVNRDLLHLRPQQRIDAGFHIVETGARVKLRPGNYLNGCASLEDLVSGHIDHVRRGVVECRKRCRNIVTIGLQYLLNENCGQVSDFAPSDDIEVETGVSVDLSDGEPEIVCQDMLTRV